MRKTLALAPVSLLTSCVTTAIPFRVSGFPFLYQSMWRLGGACGDWCALCYFSGVHLSGKSIIYSFLKFIKYAICARYSAKCCRECRNKLIYMYFMNGYTCIVICVLYM